MNCPANWYYFEPTQSCFLSLPLASLGWTLAEKQCEILAGHLASIHSEEEAKFAAVFQYTNIDSLWIGLSISNSNQTSWNWSDGSAVDYLPWGVGSPSNAIPNCVYILNNLFYDHSCYSQVYFLCKRQAF